MVLGAKGYRIPATYWPFMGQDQFGGMSFGAPQTILTHWEDRVETFVTISGEEHQSRAVVYTLQSLEVNGYLFKGESAEADPTQVVNALTIERTDEIPDLRGLHTEYKAYL